MTHCHRIPNLNLNLNLKLNLKLTAKSCPTQKMHGVYVENVNSKNLHLLKGSQDTFCSFKVIYYQAFRACFYFNCEHFRFCIHCKIKTNKKFLDFIKKCNVFFKFDKSRILMKAHFFNLGLISSAVLTFIRYKQTNKHQDKQCIYRNTG